MSGFSRKDIARIFGVSEDELADDNGYADARARAERERASFVARLRSYMSRIRVVSDEGDELAEGGRTVVWDVAPIDDEQDN